jgi:hypothetical protein
MLKKVLWAAFAFFALNAVALFIFFTGKNDFPNCTDIARAKSILPAHSHNDYVQDFPLHTALSLGFKSVEVDVYQIGKQLYVGHFWWDIRNNHTLENEYLKPLAEFFKKNSTIYTHENPLLLFVDFKTDSKKTYALLKQQIEKFQLIFDGVQNSKHHPGLVKIIITGQKPEISLIDPANRWVTLDGDEKHFTYSTDNALLFPTISLNWRHFFKAQIPLPENEEHKLKSWIALCKARHQSLRLWNAPDQPEAWDYLSHLGVQLINTDQLEAFSKNSQVKL